MIIKIFSGLSMEVALVTLYACAIFSDIWTLTCDGSLE
jgi:hypothetical protein